MQNCTPESPNSKSLNHIFSVTPEWISAELAAIDSGAAALMNRNCSASTLRRAKEAAQRLGQAMQMLGYRRAEKLAFDLERAFQNPVVENGSNENLLAEATALRMDLPGFVFLQCL